jgi:hypothetical protein
MLDNISLAAVKVRVYSVLAGREDVLLYDVTLHPQEQFDLGAVLIDGSYRVDVYHAEVDTGRYNLGIRLGSPGDPPAGRPAGGVMVNQKILSYTIAVTK